MAEKLLDSGPMMADLRAATKREIHDVNPVRVDNGEGSSTALGIRTLKCRVVTELEDMTSLSKRQLLEIRSIPFLQARSELWIIT